VDAAGRIYLSDTLNHRVQLLTPSGPSCSASVVPASLRAPAARGSLTLDIKTSESCAWAVQSLPEWIAYSNNAVGGGPTTITLEVAANSSAEGRSAVISVAGIPVSITQLGGP
jgi:hypothetical protein